MPEVKTKSLLEKQNEAVRSRMRQVVSSPRFAGNVTAAAKELRVSQSMLYEFLAKKRGAGMKILTALANYTGLSIDVLLGSEEVTPSTRGSLAEPDARARGEEIVGWEDIYTEDEIAAASAAALESYDPAEDARSPLAWANAIIDELRLERRRRAKEAGIARAASDVISPTTTDSGGLRVVPATPPRPGPSQFAQAIAQILSEQLYRPEELQLVAASAIMGKDADDHTVAEWKADLIARAEAVRTVRASIAQAMTPASAVPARRVRVTKTKKR